MEPSGPSTTPNWDCAIWTIDWGVPLPWGAGFAFPPYWGVLSPLIDVWIVLLALSPLVTVEPSDDVELLDVPPRLSPPVKSLNIEPALPVNLLPIAPNTLLNALESIPAKLVGLEEFPDASPLEVLLELDVPVE